MFVSPWVRIRALSPTIFREANGEAKFWLEPQIELAQNYGLDQRQLRAAQKLIEVHRNLIRDAWRKHFGR